MDITKIISNLFKKNNPLFLIAFLGVMIISCTKQIEKVKVLSSKQVKEKVALKYGSQYNGKRTDKAMQKFRENRFGQFIHWGLYSVPGGEWNGKTYLGAAEWLKSFAKISSKSWDSLAYQFNPTKYNAKEWAKMAKKMGVKYANITTKHHEGFCLWKSDYTDFDIELTTYNGDLIKEFVDAYTAEGIDVYFYYSILDWHHSDWRYDIKTEEDKIAFKRYFEFCKNQLLELQTKFPKVKGFWFDGTWDKSWKENGKYSYDIEMALKKINPNVIVNSRLRADDLGSRHFDSNGDLMGDYESGYERHLPENSDSTIVKIDWESCMTIPVNQWGYHKDWTLSHVKSANELIEILVKSVSLGGNSLINFGPKADGTFRDEEITIAKDIGDWMAQNSKVIYGGDYAALKKQDWGYYIKNPSKNKLYAVVFNIPIKGLLEIELDEKHILKRSILNTKQQRELTIIPHEKYYLIQLPKQDYKSPIVLELILESTKKKTNSNLHI